MSPAEFRTVREALGLSVNELARVLGLTPTYVRHLELAGNARSRPPVSKHVAERMRAYAAGYRPDNWPTRVA